MHSRIIGVSNKIFLVPLAWVIFSTLLLYCDDIKLIASGLAMLFVGILSFMLTYFKSVTSAMLICNDCVRVTTPQTAIILYSDIRFVYVKKFLWFKWIVIEKKDKTLVYLKGWSNPDQIVADIKHYAFTKIRN